MDNPESTRRAFSEVGNPHATLIHGLAYLVTLE